LSIPIDGEMRYFSTNKLSVGHPGGKAWPESEGPLLGEQRA